MIDRHETIDVATMVRPAEGEGAAAARMVELRAVQPGFPFYGKVVLQDGRPYSHDLVEKRGVLVRPELLTQLGIAVGDRLLIGGQPFTIRGVIAQEPGRRVGAFSFGSRVMVDLEDSEDPRTADARQPRQLPDPAQGGRAQRHGARAGGAA